MGRFGNVYEMILFDVDGVLLSEKRCFDTTCLSVWELLYSPYALGIAGEDFHPTPDEETINRIRQDILDEERILNWLKSRGVNSNWDMAALLFSFQLQELLKQLMEKQPDYVTAVLRKPLNRDAIQRIGKIVREEELAFDPDYGKVIEVVNDESVDRLDLLSRINQLAEEWSGVKTQVFSHGSALWNLCRDVYQEWYLGKDQYKKQENKTPVYPEKAGFLEQEIPLAEPKEIRSMLDQLIRRGIELGVGTGRPDLETKVPLASLGLLEAFDSNRIVTASDVVRAEEIYPDHAPLGKPHPFTYVKAFFGRKTSDTRSVAVRFPLSGAKRVLIVGDSVADLLAAQRMGCHFAAVLTGPSGQKARDTFEEMQADYILDHVLDLLPLIERLETESRKKQVTEPTEID